MSLKATCATLPILPIWLTRLFPLLTNGAAVESKEMKEASAEVDISLEAFGSGWTSARELDLLFHPVCLIVIRDVTAWSRIGAWSNKLRPRLCG